MSSPPTSGTSTEPALLHRRQRRFNLRSSSFAGLSPFHKKPNPRAPKPTEPYEVAPGILNTDATAIVFGYLEREKQAKLEERKKSRKTKHKHPDDRKRNRSRSPVKKVYDRYKEVHDDDGTDDFRNRTHKKRVDAEVQALQEKRENSHRIWKESQERSTRGRMVSEEDKLQSRGANPRTGIVTPYVASDNSSDSGYASDYLKVRSHLGPTVNQGSWRQNEKGWSLVEDSDVLIYPQETPTEPPAVARSTTIKDQASTESPVTNERILRYQRSIRKAYQGGDRSRPFVDPNAPPSPRQRTPEGPSSPPPRLTRILRKQVGSGVSHREESEDTVVVNGRLRASSVPPLQRYPEQRHRVRILTPQHARTSGHVHLRDSKSFLGSHLGLSPSRYPLQSAVRAEGGPRFVRKAVPASSSCPNMEFSNYQTQNSIQHQESIPPHARYLPALHPLASVSNLSQSLPPLRFPHPSQFNGVTVTCGQPRNQRPSNFKESHFRQDTTDVPITTTTTTTMQPTLSQNHPSLRPGLYRQGGTTYVPHSSPQHVEMLNFSSNLPQITLRNSPQKSIITDGVTSAVKTRNSYTTLKKNTHHEQSIPGAWYQNQTQMETLQELRTAAKQPLRGASPPGLSTITNGQSRSCSETYNGWVVPDAQTEFIPYPINPEKVERNAHVGPRSVDSDNLRSTPTRIGTKTITEGMRAGSGNIDIAGQPASWSHTVGRGSIHIEGMPDKDFNCVGGGLRHRLFGGVQRTREGEDGEPRRRRSKKAGKDRDGVSMGWDGTTDAHDAGGTCDILRTDSLRRRISEVKSLCRNVNIGLHFRPYAAARFGLRALVVMVHHVVMTLNPSSKALLVLRMEDTTASEYWYALREILWASVYVLLLVNFLLVLGRVVKAMIVLGKTAFGPARVVWVVVRWCLVG